MRVNVIGVWFMVMGFLLLLEKGNYMEWGKGGVSFQVIVVSLIVGFNKKVFGGWVYGVSKVVVMYVGKMLSGLVIEWGMRVNVVCLGCEFYFGYLVLGRLGC